MKSKFQVISDDRGSLIPINFDEIPFVPKRIFVVDNVPEKSVRAGHAHRECQQVLICLNGIVDVWIDSASGMATYPLQKGNSLFHDRMEWAEITFVAPESRLLSICSREYDEADYIRDWNEWVKLKQLSLKG